jgi:hypothetical protein
LSRQQAGAGSGPRLHRSLYMRQPTDTMTCLDSDLSHHAVAKEINYLFYSIETDDRVHGILSHGDIMRISNTSQRGWLYRKNRFYISAWMSRDNLRI